MIGPKFILFLVLAIPGQQQPAVHTEEIASLEQCMETAYAVLQKATEKEQLLQAGCITIPGRDA